ncbi:protein windbeutel [Lutzomyia longipalpis]|uniref:protein windbeutel n=1 Tax=Lutzomyia longipalpis TaxID=7200 RepID=UPI0024845332|nr:protein windbeutel [Lutzomyia longipalpis]
MFLLKYYFLTLLAIGVLLHSGEACKGCVELDEITFDKLISRFPATLVKFDVAYPYGDKHEAFSAFAQDVAEVDDLLVALVGIKDYGEKDNANLGKKYNVEEKDLPRIKIIKRDNPKEWIDYPADLPVTKDNIKTFVRENTNLYIGLTGCLQEFDELAARFMEALAKDEKEAQEVLKEAQEEEKKFNGEENSGRMYIAIMQRVLEKGEDFIASERERVKGLQGKKLSPSKKLLLEHRLNILAAFKHTKSTTSDKSEL